jgi:hypothetical protein
MVYPNHKAVVAPDHTVEVTEATTVTRGRHLLEVLALDSQHLLHRVDEEGHRPLSRVDEDKPRVPSIRRAGHAKLPVQVEHRDNAFADIGEAQDAALGASHGSDRDHGQDLIDHFDVEAVVGVTYAKEDELAGGSQHRHILHSAHLLRTGLP